MLQDVNDLFHMHWNGSKSCCNYNNLVYKNKNKLTLFSHFMALMNLENREDVLVERLTEEFFSGSISQGIQTENQRNTNFQFCKNGTLNNKMKWNKRTNTKKEELKKAAEQRCHFRIILVFLPTNTKSKQKIKLNTFQMFFFFHFSWKNKKAIPSASVGWYI